MSDFKKFIRNIKTIILSPIIHPKPLQRADYQDDAADSENFAPNIDLFAPTNSDRIMTYDMDSFPPRLARLKDHGGDISKRWYVEFYCYDGLKKKVVRKRMYQINQAKTIPDRRKFARDQIKKINRALMDGLHLNDQSNLKMWQREETRVFKIKRITWTLDYILKIIKKTNRHATYLSYKSDVKIFGEFLKAYRMDRWVVTQLNREIVFKFIDYLSIEKNASNATINNKVASLKTLFGKIKERGMIDDNPFIGIKKLKVTVTNQNEAYSQVQVAQLKKIITQDDPYLWFFIQFIYYCYIRPAEITRLQVKHINLKTGRITIPAAISKNAKTATLNMPDPLLKIIQEEGICDYPDHYYIFSSMQRPSETPISKNYMSGHHKKIIEKLNLKKNFTLYSWKHTGVVNAYQAGIDIKSIQMQCRHHSIQQTDTYLKSLGFTDNKEILRIPEI